MDTGSDNKPETQSEIIGAEIPTGIIEPAPMGPIELAAQNPEAYMAYYGELMLAKWKDDPNGMTVEFFIPDQEINPFKHHTKRSRTRGGTRFLAVMVELGDDELPIDQKQRAILEKALVEKTKGGKISRRAGMVCQEPEFHQFLKFKLYNMDLEQQQLIRDYMPGGLVQRGLPALEDPKTGAEFAKHFIYYWCGVSSRAQLDHKKKSREIFETLYQDFINWQSSQRG